MEEIEAWIEKHRNRVIKRETDRRYYQKNKEILIKKKAETNSIRYWKDPELARKKDREWRKAYILKYA